MQVRWTTAFLDRPAAVEPVSTAFWQVVTGSGLSARRGPTGGLVTLLPPDGDAYLRVQALGSGPPRTHLDLHTDDVAAAAVEAQALGALVRDRDAVGGYVVLSSPGGVVFCLVAWRGERARPAARPGPDGATLLDQVSVDVPSQAHPAEVAFWSTLTGWAAQPGAYGHLVPLVRGAGLPLRLLVQRLDRSDAPPSAHPDLACADVRAATARHEQWGATVLRRTEHWTTLRDPGGGSYCLTRRDPGTGLLPTS